MVPTQEQLCHPQDIWLCLDKVVFDTTVRDGVAPGIEATVAAKQPTIHRTTPTKNCPAPNANSVTRLRNPGLELLRISTQCFSSGFSDLLKVRLLGLKKQVSFFPDRHRPSHADPG